MAGPVKVYLPPWMGGPLALSQLKIWSSSKHLYNRGNAQETLGKSCMAKAYPGSTVHLSPDRGPLAAEADC